MFHVDLSIDLNANDLSNTDQAAYNLSCEEVCLSFWQLTAVRRKRPILKLVDLRLSCRPMRSSWYQYDWLVLLGSLVLECRLFAMKIHSLVALAPPNILCI